MRAIHSIRGGIIKRLKAQLQEIVNRIMCGGLKVIYIRDLKADYTAH